MFTNKGLVFLTVEDEKKAVAVPAERRNWFGWYLQIAVIIAMAALLLMIGDGR